MKKRNLLLVILAILLVFGMVVGCGEDPAGGGGGGTPTNTATLNSVAADGGATAFTTQLTLTFSKAIAGLSADDITLSGVTGVTKGTLAGSGPTYTLPISGFSQGGTLTVKVTKEDFTITPATGKTVTVNDAANFFQKFYATYNNNSNQTITETLDITRTLIKFTDNEVKLTDNSAAVDYLNFEVSKLENSTVKDAVNTKYPINPQALREIAFTKAIKVTGKITGAKPPRGSITSIYGTTTCPGIALTDIKNDTQAGTELYFFLYITEETNKVNTSLVKSAFYKTPTQTGANAPSDPIERREYVINDQDED